MHHAGNVDVARDLLMQGGYPDKANKRMKAPYVCRCKADAQSSRFAPWCHTSELVA